MVDPVASAPASSSKVAVKADIKVATPNLIIQGSELVPIEIMTDLIFEDIGGQEIITITRSDIINGQDVLYRPIKYLAIMFLPFVVIIFHSPHILYHYTDFLLTEDLLEQVRLVPCLLHL